jgi:acyl-CoA reductase-like NAD-dependent aldehyde dehydrogenase
VPYTSAGGCKQSGIGRERAPNGTRSFQRMKNVTVGTLIWDDIECRADEASRDA